MPPLLAVGEVKGYLARIIMFLNVGPHLDKRRGGEREREKERERERERD